MPVERKSRKQDGAVPSYFHAHGLDDVTGDAHQRFWSKVDKRGPDECWPWTGCTKYGYGQLRQRIGPRSHNKQIGIPAQRVSYELANGSISSERLVQHSCHTSLCVNPKHLVEGTHEDNMAGMREAGRSLSGARNPRARLSVDDVNDIRRARRNGVILKDLATKYGVDFTTIDYAARGGSWGSGISEPPVKAKLRRISKDQLQEMYAKWQNDLSFKDLQREYGFSDTTIGERLRKLAKEKQCLI